MDPTYGTVINGSAGYSRKRNPEISGVALSMTKENEHVVNVITILKFDLVNRVEDFQKQKRESRVTGGEGGGIITTHK
jgi:hypothetical protein